MSGTEQDEHAIRRSPVPITCHKPAFYLANERSRTRRACNPPKPCSQNVTENLHVHRANEWIRTKRACNQPKPCSQNVTGKSEHAKCGPESDMITMRLWRKRDPPIACIACLMQAIAQAPVVPLTSDKKVLDQRVLESQSMTPRTVQPSTQSA